MAMLKPYMTELLAKGKREDGRKPFDYRDIKIETGIIARANGSARVLIGKTEVLVGVKLDVGVPFPDSPESGVLMVNAELLPLASPSFEFGPPSKDSIELSRVIDRGIRECHAIDLDKLCIKPEEKVLHKELTKTKLPVQKIPVLTTFGKLSGNLFVDATMREEKEVDARLSIATIEDGTASAMQKGGSGPLTAEEVIELTEKAVELGKKLRKLIPSK